MKFCVEKNKIDVSKEFSEKTLKTHILELFEELNLRINEKTHTLINQFLSEKDEMIFQKIIPPKKF